jgi:hypothetical protein
MHRAAAGAAKASRFWQDARTRAGAGWRGIVQEPGFNARYLPHTHPPLSLCCAYSGSVAPVGSGRLLDKVSEAFGLGLLSNCGIESLLGVG